jgi:geranylgeranyl pyrophosphate synthase
MSTETTKALMADLERRGTKGLKLAKKTMQKEKIEYLKLHEALQHYIANWNDYTHAGLFSLACEAVGGDPDPSIPIQASIAMIAASFDIQDDIIDHSETKHSVPTVYGKYGEEIAILLGNAFLIQGFTMLVSSINEQMPERMLEVMQLLKADLFEVGNAHGLELGLKGRENATQIECIDFVQKKAASIEADMALGAIIGGGNDLETKALAEYGRVIGILTTLREEFIDMYESEELVQKSRINRLPIPILFAFQELERKKEIEEIIAKKELTDDDVATLVEIVCESRFVKNLKRDMKHFATLAISAANKLDKKSTKEILIKWVSSMLEDL